MAEKLIRVRMLRHVTQFVQVYDLELDGVYDIIEQKAEQLISNGVAERVDSKKARLEAAALESAQRRG